MKNHILKMRMRKGAGFVLSAAVAVSLCGGTGVAAFAAEADDDAAVEVMDEDSGLTQDEEGCYLLYSADDILTFADMVSGGSADIDAELMNDVTISADTGFAGIGTTSAPYAGTFDGNGNTVTVSIDTTGVAGFFDYVSGATIENLTVAGSVTTSSTSTSNGASGLVANVPTSGSGVSVLNCVNEADITAVGYVGGLIGFVQNSASSPSVTIKDSSNKGVITSTGNSNATGYTGGIAARMIKGEITNCINYGSITTDSYSTGGITSQAYSYGTVKITNCGNEGSITGSKYYIGGIVGRVAPNSTYNESTELSALYNSGAVSSTASGTYTGGIIGYAYYDGLSLTDVYNVGTVNGYTTNTGGIVAYVNAETVLSNAYNAGDVNYGILAGGISSAGRLTVDNVWYLDTLTGLPASTETFTSYIYSNDTQAALTDEEIAAMAVSSEELAALADTLGENFKENSVSDYHQGYPILTWEDNGASEEETYDCEVSGHIYEGGVCSVCGDINPDYDWYYDNTDAEEFSVSTAAELAALADLVNALDLDFAGCTISLEGDISLSGISWEPIAGSGDEIYLTIESQEDLNSALEEHFIIYDSNSGSYVRGSGKNAAYDSTLEYYYLDGSFFAGTFEGNGYTISDMSIVSDQGSCGLFGQVSGTIRNFTVIGKIENSATNADYVGGACGRLAPGGTISGVTADVDIKAYSSSSQGCYNVGGVVGMVGEPGFSLYTDTDAAVVEQCENRGDVAGYVRVGGVAGRNAGIIRECANFGEVYNASASKKGTGGIVGMNGVNNTATDGGLVEDCYNAGYVNGNKGYWTGGIVGFQNSLSLTQNCYNCSNLGIYNSSTGAAYSWSNPGIGQNEGTAINIYGVDSVVGSDGSTTVGNSGGTSTNCIFYSAAQMTGQYDDDEEEQVDFVAILNGEDRTVWVTDTKDANDGYPILSFQASSAGEDTGLNGVYEDGEGNLAYYVDGVIDTDFTGLAQGEDGILYYVENGYVGDYTGIVQDDDGTLYYAESGCVGDFTGMAKYEADGLWYYFADGQADLDYTGMAKCPTNSQWYYFTDGQLDWSFTGLAKYAANGCLYYFANGQLDWTYTGLAKYSNGCWYYVANGELDWSYSGTVEYNGSTYTVTNGELDWSAATDEAA